MYQETALAHCENVHELLTKNRDQSTWYSTSIIITSFSENMQKEGWILNGWKTYLLENSFESISTSMYNYIQGVSFEKLKKLKVLAQKHCIFTPHG